MAGVYIALNEGQIPQEAMPLAQQVVRIEVFDNYAVEQGID